MAPPCEWKKLVFFTVCRFGAKILLQVNIKAVHNIKTSLGIILHHGLFVPLSAFLLFLASGVPVSVEVKLSFVEPGRRWAHSLSPSKAPGIFCQGTMKTSVKM